MLVLMTSATAAIGQEAENYPNRPIKLIVPYPPGGSTDPAARLLADRAGSHLGQPIVVENLSGAGGTIGTAALARSAPDGYTLLLHTSTMSTYPTLNKNLPFDVTRDFAPVTLAVTGAYLLVVNPSLPVNNVAELIAYAKANPGKLNYGSAGVGTGAHLVAEMFLKAADIDVVHVPYRGSGLAVAGLVGGEIQMLVDTLSGSRSLVESGKLRAIAVTGSERSPQMPNIPTVAESGVKDFSATYWLGIFAPAKTPQPIIDKLYNAFETALDGEPVRSKMYELGNEARALSPAEFTSVLDDDIARYRAIIESANISID